MRSQVSPSASSNSQDKQLQHLPKSVIPTQRRVTEQLTKNWAPFKVLRQRYADTRCEEQRQLHLPQKHKATVAGSTQRVEMNGLEEQADNAKARELFWKPLSWLGTIRPTSANDAFCTDTTLLLRSTTPQRSTTRRATTLRTTTRRTTTLPPRRRRHAQR